MGKKRSYLSRLPEASQRKGNAKKGEAEIITTRRDVERIDAECRDELSGSALGRNGKRIGILLEDEVRMVVRDPLLFPSGVTKCQMRIIGKTEYDGVNGVAVLALREGRILLREIFRHPRRTWELETTRGRRETGQTPRQAVRAEVRQELGYNVRKIHRLGTVCPETALMSSTIEIFLAELSPRRRGAEPEAGEALGRIVELTPDELGALIAVGKVRDSYTIVALMLAQLKGLVPPVTLAA